MLTFSIHNSLKNIRFFCGVKANNLTQGLYSWALEGVFKNLSRKLSTENVGNSRKARKHGPFSCFHPLLNAIKIGLKKGVEGCLMWIVEIQVMRQAS